MVASFCEKLILVIIPVSKKSINSFFIFGMHSRWNSLSLFVPIWLQWRESVQLVHKDGPRLKVTGPTFNIQAIFFKLSCSCEKLSFDLKFSDRNTLANSVDPDRTSSLFVALGV